MDPFVTFLLVALLVSAALLAAFVFLEWRQGR